MKAISYFLCFSVLLLLSFTTLASAEWLNDPTPCQDYDYYWASCARSASSQAIYWGYPNFNTTTATATYNSYQLQSYAETNDHNPEIEQRCWSNAWVDFDSSGQGGQQNGDCNEFALWAETQASVE
jgi:hypothetical protein